jgi:hypothetical protein
MQDLGELAALGHQSGSATQDAQRMLRITAQHAEPSHATTAASST